MAQKRYNEVQPTSIGMSKSTNIKQAKQERNPVDKKRKRANSSENSMEDWPKSLQEFAAKSFQRAEEELDEKAKATFRIQIQQLLNMALAENAIWTTNWSAQKVPVLDNVELELQPLLLSTEPLPMVPSPLLVTRAFTPQPSSRTFTPIQGDYDSQAKKRQRASRFESNDKSDSNSPYPETGVTIVGRSLDLEKNYLRLTTAPNPDNVRPFERLQKSMEYVLLKYGHTKNYSYIINQFKSIRQDLTVQHIKGDFTIHVYETNARISLENNDLGEFNQCQSQLKVLYYQKRKGLEKERFYGAEVEFLIYRIIYMIMTSNYGEIYKLKLSTLTNYHNFRKSEREEKLFGFIDQLFQLNQDILNGNYYNFFQIIKFDIDLPLAFQLINNYITNKVRVRALGKISKSYRIISVAFLIDLLKFVNIANLAKFLTDYGLFHFLIKDATEFDCLNARHIIAEIIQGASFKKVDIKGQI